MIYNTYFNLSDVSMVFFSNSISGLVQADNDNEYWKITQIILRVWVTYKSAQSINRTLDIKSYVLIAVIRL